MGIQGRVFVQFTIGKDGSITGIRTRGPDKNLEKEADRIISKLPRMTPGKQRGRPVRVPFSVPITFKLQKNTLYLFVNFYYLSYICIRLKR